MSLAGWRFSSSLKQHIHLVRSTRGKLAKGGLKTNRKSEEKNRIDSMELRDHRCVGFASSTARHEAL